MDDDDDDMRALARCFQLLRITFASCWSLERVDNKWMTKRSRPNCIVNLSTVALLLYVFAKVITHQHRPTIYKYSTLVFPLYTEFLIIVDVLFLLCGNVCGRHFADVVNRFPAVVGRLEFALGGGFHTALGTGTRAVLVKGLLWAAFSTAFKFYVEFHLVLSYPRLLRIAHYFTSFAVTAFTISFVAAMDHVGRNYRRLNIYFRRIIYLGEGEEGVAICRASSLSLGRKVKEWTTVFMELREVEDAVNKVFGKNIFLTLLLSFSSVIINLYYFVALNLYKTSNVWLNVCFAFWLFEATGFLYIIVRAAESAASEANRVNRTVFYLPMDFEDWSMYRKVKYFVMFLHRCPTQFRAWVFYTVDYSSFFKVMAASSALTILFLQCEFMRPRGSA